MTPPPRRAWHLLLPTASLQVFPDAGSTWHPGRSAKVGLGPKTIVASFGELHPRLQKALDAPANADLEALWGDRVPALFAGDPGTRTLLCYHQLDVHHVARALSAPVADRVAD